MSADIVLTLLDVVLGLMLTFIGIEMVNNPPDTSRKKNMYRVSFAVLGAAIVIVTLVHSVRTAKEQEVEEQIAHTDQMNSENKLSYMQGTLDAIAKFETQFIASDSKDQSSKEAVQMAAQILRAIAPPPSPTKSIYQAMSNTQLQEAAIALARQLRQCEDRYDSQSDAVARQWQSSVSGATTTAESGKLFQTMVASEEQVNKNEQLEFRQQYLGQAVALRDEMLQRIPNPPHPQGAVVAAFDSGILAGPFPVANTGDYLERLARELPVKR